MEKQSIFVKIMGESKPIDFPIDSEKIVINDDRVTEIDLSTIKDFPKLKELVIKAEQIFDINLDALAECPLLEQLSISGVDTETIDLSPLKQLQCLRVLSISDCSLARLDLAPAQDIRGLVEISLPRNNLKAIDLSPLKGHKILQKINLSGNAINRINLAPLGEIESLEFLDLSDNHINRVSLIPLRKCSRLEKLDLSGNQMSQVNLQPLESCRLMRRLILSRNKLSEINLEALRDMYQLLELRLDGNRLAQIDLQPLTSCTSLKILDISNNRLITVDLKPLKRCKGLELIGLSNNSLTEIDLMPLGALKELQHLVISSNELKEVDLYPLSHCINLLRLSINGNHIQSLDLYPLAFCARLAQLGIDMIDKLIEAGHKPDSSLFNVDLSPLYFCKMLRSVDITKREKNPIGARIILSDPPEFIRKVPGALTEFLKSPSRRYGLLQDSLIQTIQQKGFEHARDHLLGILSHTDYEEWDRDIIAYWELSIPVLVDHYGWSKIWGAFESIMMLTPPSVRPKEYQELFRRFRLAIFAGYDGSMNDMFKDDWNWKKGHKELRKALLVECKNQIELGGSTLFFKPPLFDVTDPKEAELRQILEKRRIEEIRDVRIYDYGDCFDLRPLWLTSIGFEFLWNQQFWLFTGINGIRTVTTFFENRKMFLAFETVKKHDEVKDFTQNRPISKQHLLFILRMIINNASPVARAEGFKSLGQTDRVDLVNSVAQSII